MAIPFFSSSKKLGILGAGQLGKMLLPTTQAWDIYTKMLDPDPEAPCAALCNEFVVGSLQDYDTVYAFGKDCDVITIEIEHVNTDALIALQLEGKKIHPDPRALKMIQDKGLQKQFYAEHNLPTAPFKLYENKDGVLLALQEEKIKIPFVQKSRTAGYDGKGVHIVRHENDLNNLLEGPCVIENAIDIQTEVAVIVARNERGEVAVYDASMMEFHEGANMLDLLLYPAPLPEAITKLAQAIAKTIIEKMDLCGLLAVEFLLDKNDQLWVNEVAPRPHNSGHQTIESAVTSQYQQHIRAILNLPLGSTTLIKPSAMVNILGIPEQTGKVVYEGVEACLQQPGIYIHLYGKKITKPFRKMGHATVVHDSLEEAKKIALWVRQTIKASSL
jgi:5-(carboxyamino)imidazole ribonucleotide synthase